MGHWFHHQKVAKEYEEKISDLRNKDVTQPIGTCALLMNSKGQVLLGKRKNSYKAGCYGLPGGRIELNESIEKAIKREVEEETGIELEEVDYIGVVRENQGNYDFIHFVYAAKDVIQTPLLKEPEKCEGWEWVDLNEVKDKILLGHLAAIQMYKQQIHIIDLTK